MWIDDLVFEKFKVMLPEEVDASVIDLVIDESFERLETFNMPYRTLLEDEFVITLTDDGNIRLVYDVPYGYDWTFNSNGYLIQT